MLNGEELRRQMTDGRGRTAEETISFRKKEWKTRESKSCGKNGDAVGRRGRRVNGRSATSALACKASMRPAAGDDWLRSQSAKGFCEQVECSSLEEGRRGGRHERSPNSALAMHDRPNIAPGANYSRKQRENERTRVSLTVLVL